MNHAAPRGLILVRTRRVDEHTRLFADQLRTASGLDVRFLVDERRERRASIDPQIISLNPSNYRALGLFTPQDAAWRCGDYGIYMAWQAHPDCEFFWLIEDDVRISGNVEEFFARCSLSAADLLAVNLIEAERDHFWWAHTVAKDTQPYRCFFGAVRLSAEAVRRCYRKRVEHGKKLNRLALWPNDESLVATTVINSGLLAADFNALGAELYDLETFSIFGDPVAFVSGSGTPRLIHPVRFEARRDSTSHRKIDDSRLLPFRIRRAVIRRLNRHSGW